MKTINRIERLHSMPFELKDVDELGCLEPLEDDDKVVAIFEERARELGARAISRRKTATRNFDASKSPWGGRARLTSRASV